jgi:hypothetical protein
MLDFNDDNADEPEGDAPENLRERPRAPSRENAGARVPTVTRDERGRWLPGSVPNPGGAAKGSRRPRLIDVARDLTASAGIELDEALRRVLASMMRAAGRGDVAAGRLVLERLTVDEDQSLRGGLSIEGAGTGAAGGPPVPQGPAFVEYMRRLAATYREIGAQGHARTDPAHQENMAVVAEGQAADLERGLAAEARAAATREERERAELEALLA